LAQAKENSVVRPTNTIWAGTGVTKFSTAMGPFIGESPPFFTYPTGLATAADTAQQE
jgi:hypothetical protein